MKVWSSKVSTKCYYRSFSLRHLNFLTSLCTRKYSTVREQTTSGGCYERPVDVLIRVDRDWGTLLEVY